MAALSIQVFLDIGQIARYECCLLGLVSSVGICSVTAGLS